MKGGRVGVKCVRSGDIDEESVESTWTGVSMSRSGVDKEGVKRSLGKEIGCAGAGEAIICSRVEADYKPKAPKTSPAPCTVPPTLDLLLLSWVSPVSFLQSTRQTTSRSRANKDRTVYLLV